MSAEEKRIRQDEREKIIADLCMMAEFDRVMGNADGAKSLLSAANALKEPEAANAGN